MLRDLFFTLFILFFTSRIQAQFAPQVPLPGNDAISANDNRIIGWATNCTVERGWMDIADTALGKVTNGSGSDVIGPPSLQVLSLGDRGSAIVSFASPIKDGPGPDFAVFENGFANPVNDTLAFLELAFVAVSSDGIHYVTFPSICNIQDTTQFDFAYSDARLIHNLAGKYINGYGTPFDLSELVDSPNLDIQNIRFVRVTDVVGSLDPQYASYDVNGHKINDPYPTPFATGGFDFNAVGVLNQQPLSIDHPGLSAKLQLSPNPTRDFVEFKTESNQGIEYFIYDLSGKMWYSGHGNGLIRISVKQLTPGEYFLRFRNLGSSSTFQVLKFIKS